MKYLTVAACLATSALLAAGCSTVDCNGRSAPYADAQARRPLQPVAGATAPERAHDYDIPGAGEKPVHAPAVSEDTCFVQPPQLVPEPTEGEEEDAAAQTAEENAKSGD